MTIRHTISIPDPMSHYIDLQITSGLYGNISEYMGELKQTSPKFHRILRKPIAGKA